MLKKAMILMFDMCNNNSYDSKRVTTFFPLLLAYYLEINDMCVFRKLDLFLNMMDGCSFLDLPLGIF